MCDGDQHARVEECSSSAGGGGEEGVGDGADDNADIYVAAEAGVGSPFPDGRLIEAGVFRIGHDADDGFGDFESWSICLPMGSRRGRTFYEGLFTIAVLGGSAAVNRRP